MRGLDVIGAGESLAPYTILVRVRKVDPAKLRAVITDKPWGAAIPGAIQMADSAPELALEVVLPIIKTELETIGITADLSKTKTPPKGSSSHEMEIVFGVGAVLGVVLALFGKTLYSLIKAK